ncbi:hypothetical protein M3699_11455 [Peribacillus simplex]|uniref:hypothetical protein n=1 Tax=Peribacillus simplex TaxID=1478 RepID=UPI00203AF213|nr:hypothetical protein [Peribacillus simplex]MCM3674489.1 hypothetical protein [Peribacillus simplex]
MESLYAFIFKGLVNEAMPGTINPCKGGVKKTVHEWFMDSLGAVKGYGDSIEESPYSRYEKERSFWKDQIGVVPIPCPFII